MNIPSTHLTPEMIATLDTQNMRGSIGVFEQQCTDAWEMAQKIDYGTHTGITHIAFFAMGGSALGMDVVRAAYAHALKVPVTIINDYSIPASVNSNTFVILSSYSGTTEETLAAAEHILEKTSHVAVITTGSALATWAQEHNVPAYVYVPKQNPSNQPRMAIGYSIASVLSILNSVGLLTVTPEDINELIAGIRHAQTLCAELTESNPALMLARTASDRVLTLFSSEHLDGIMHAVTNQINENGKLFAVRFSLPEANHHLTEALVAPAQLPAVSAWIGVSSALYHPRTQLRYTLTHQLLESKGFTSTVYHTQGRSKMADVGEMLVIGGWTSFYIAMLSALDPSPIPNVDWFKAALKNSAA